MTQILHDKLGIEKFCIFENDLIKGSRKIVFQTENMEPCCCVEKNVREVCRAERTDNVVVSKNFPKLCRAAECEDGKEYVCIPFMINDQKSVTVHIICDNEECLKHINYQIGIIKKYLALTFHLLLFQNLQVFHRPGG